MGLQHGHILNFLLLLMYPIRRFKFQKKNVKINTKNKFLEDSAYDTEKTI